MPTKKRRVGFIPRNDVMKIIDKLSFENNLSNSKVINILVEEALALRGIYDLKTGKEKNKLQKQAEKLFLSEEKSIEDKSLNDLNKLNNKNILFEANNIQNKKDEITFDRNTFEKFVSFLKFQEMIKKYET